MAEIANAWISIVPDTSKIAPGIKKALGSVEAPAQQAGSSMGSKLSGALGKTMKIGVGAAAASVGAAAGGVLATSLAKGFGRLNALDQAQAKMRGLGYDAKDVGSLMDSVSKSVKGTAFGLDEAAGSAAKLGAVGVKTGAEMDRAMTLTADIAAQAGTSMDDVSSIMAKIAGAGKVTGETLAQLDDRATGAGAAIADHLGVSIDEARDKISKGQVDFATFQEAMEKHLGGGAQATGETFKGAFDNMMSATGRLGQKLLDPVFKAAPGLFGSVGKAVDELGEAIGPSMERIGTVLAPAFERAGTAIENKLAPAIAKAAPGVADFIESLAKKAVDPAMWDRIGEGFAKIWGTVKDLAPSIGALVGAFARVAASVSVNVWVALAGVLNALAPIITSVLVPVLEKVADIAERHPGVVQAAVTSWLGFKIVGAVAAPISKVASVVSKTTGGLKLFGSTLKTSWTYAGQAGAKMGVLGKAWLIVKTNVVAGAKALTKANGPLGALARGAAKVGPAIATVGRVIGSGLVTAVKLAAGAFRALGVAMAANPIGAIIAVIGLVVAALWAFFTKTEIGRQMWQSFMDWLSSAWQAVSDTAVAIWQGLCDFLSNLWTAITTTAVARWQAFVGMLSGLWSGVVGIATAAWSAVSSFFSGLWEGIKSVALGAWNALVAGVVAIWNGAVSVITGVSSAITSGLSAGWGMLKSLASAAWNGIKTVILAVWEAVKTGVLAVWNALSGAISAGWNFIKNLASSVWNGIKTAVLAAWEGLKAGITAGINIIRNGISGFVNFARERFNAFTSAVGAIPGKIKSAFSGAAGWLRDAGRNIIAGLRDGITSAAGWITSAIKSLVPSSLQRFLPFVDGGLFFAQGGVQENHRAMIARAGSGRTPFRVWAEPETGGEAYIPLAASKRARSTQILATVADKFGLSLTGRDGRPLPAASARAVAPTGQAFADGGITTPHDLLRFAKGENVAGKAAARSLEGAPYVFGGSNWGDCSGAMSQLASAVSNAGNWFVRKFFTGSQGGWLSQHGFKSGLGSGPRFSVGFLNGGPGGGHTSGTIFFGDGKRVNVEMGGGRGNGQIGGPAAGADHSQYTDRYHYPLSGGSAAGSAGAAAVAAGATPTATSTQGITLTGGKSIEWGEAANLFSEVQKNRKLSAAMSRWKSGAFDQGGVANGLGFLPKATIKPERVLNPSNTKSFDKLPGVLADVANKLGVSAEAQAMAARAGNNIAAAMQGMSASEILGYGEKLGLGDFTNLAKGSVSAWESVEKSLVAQVDAADGVKQAEENLKTARAEYAQAMAEDTELTVQQKRRLEDAMKAVSDAKRPDKNGAVNADRVAKAELKLERVREDIAAEQEKAGKKQSETAQKAAENLLKAETELADARGVVVAAAKAAGHAEVAFAIEIVDMVLKVADKIIGAVMTARSVVASAVHSTMQAVGQLVDMTSKLREQVAFAALEQAEAQIKMNAAARGIRMAQIDGVRSQLEAAKTVAEAQAKFDAQRQADMRASLLSYQDLSLAMDRWRWAMHNGISESLEGMVAWSDASHALWAELQAATIGRQIAEKQAQVNTLKAVYEHQKAALDLQEATTALSVASQKLAVMAGKAFGYDNVQATVGSRFTELMAEKAKLQADQASIKTWINPVNWFTSMPAATSRIEQIDRELAELAKLPEFKQFTPDQLRELERIQASAGAMGFFGAGDKVEAMIKNSSLGDAARALDRAKFEHELIDAKNATTVARQKLESKQAEVDYAAQVAPIEALIDQLKSKQESEKTWAEYWREEDSQVREALARLAKFQADAAASMNAGLNDPKVIQLVGDKFDADTLEKALGELGIRVEKLERPTSGGASVAASRR